MGSIVICVPPFEAMRCDEAVPRAKRASPCFGPDRLQCRRLVDLQLIRNQIHTYTWPLSDARGREECGQLEHPGVLLIEYLTNASRLPLGVLLASKLSIEDPRHILQVNGKCIEQIVKRLPPLVEEDKIMRSTHSLQKLDGTNADVLLADATFLSTKGKRRVDALDIMDPSQPFSHDWRNISFQSDGSCPLEDATPPSLFLLFLLDWEELSREGAVSVLRVLEYELRLRASVQRERKQNSKRQVVVRLCPVAPGQREHKMKEQSPCIAM